MEIPAPSYDYAEALKYISSLLPQMDDFPLESGGLQLQPSLGPFVINFLNIFILALRPREILEIGTSVGESAIEIARSVESYGGIVTTMELNRKIAGLALSNFQSAGLEGSIKLLVGDAKELIKTIPNRFGLIIQDGGKDDYIMMLDRLVELLEPRGVLISDDVLFPIMGVEKWGKQVDDYNRALRDHPKIATTWLPIGDGIAISIKL